METFSTSLLSSFWLDPLFSHFGPDSLMAMAPMGAVMRMTKTAIVNTISP